MKKSGTFHAFMLTLALAQEVMVEGTPEVGHA
jgi:hypothetical protein